MKLCICSIRSDREPAIDDLKAFLVDGAAFRVPDMISGLVRARSAI